MATDYHMKILQRVISTYQPFFILMLCRTEYFPSLSSRCRNTLNSIKWELDRIIAALGALSLGKQISCLSIYLVG